MHLVYVIATTYDLKKTDQTNIGLGRYILNSYKEEKEIFT